MFWRIDFEKAMFKKRIKNSADLIYNFSMSILTQIIHVWKIKKLFKTIIIVFKYSKNVEESIQWPNNNITERIRILEKTKIWRNKNTNIKN